MSHRSRLAIVALAAVPVLGIAAAACSASSDASSPATSDTTTTTAPTTSVDYPNDLDQRLLAKGFAVIHDETENHDADYPIIELNLNCPDGVARWVQVTNVTPGHEQISLALSSRGYGTDDRVIYTFDTQPTPREVRNLKLCRG